ncbi:hypothetical protein BEWA_010380 [Theileria equi strain WA]|uniref:CSC1/OSCA1-like cytosolic domain-containing protein n=1 Tax=Theileria equi strain WA TaxID=1537102 RepID=L0B180_THEEQ|nr:hypothetical protein BEWA_010380 [Theileria equi strain WA]AFZ81622.1 hypothetical protein BEWA_010380 [Theileria equi strain WA]|eukprot:XP_004831288.1 hypothetical protein BEWA_010380 [Theileria equi strain WA]
MESEDKGYLVFIGIVIFDLTLFSLALFLWSKYRLQIIALTHNGFANRNIRFTKLLSDSINLVEDKNKIVKVLSPHSIEKKNINHIRWNSRTNGPVSHATITHLRSSSNDNSGLYVKVSNDSIGTDDIPGASALARALYKYKSSERWWNPLLYDCSNKIENNEANLYLKFMSKTCKMLLICFMFSVIINGCVFLYFLSQGNPHIFLVYTFEDMLNCKVTTWALYIMVWIYSFIAYYFVSIFRNNLDGKKQVTAILRPQLHTIMVAGFNKSITNPSLIYNHFNTLFPGQVISTHIVMDHSKRLRYEHELENEKLQLTGLYDLVSISSTCQLNKSDVTSIRDISVNHSDVSHTYGKTSIVRSLSANLGESEIFTTKSESDKKVNKSLSSQNLTYVPTAKAEVTGSQAVIEKETHEYYGDMKQHFFKHIDRIKRLKIQIEEEKNKIHNVSARVCFVSFADSNIVLHILKDNKILDFIPQWHISPAPHPNDLIWLNLHISRYNVLLRMLFFNFLLVVFYVGVTYLLIKLNMIKRFTKIDLDETGNSQGVHFDVFSN